MANNSQEIKCTLTDFFSRSDIVQRQRERKKKWEMNVGWYPQRISLCYNKTTPALLLDVDACWCQIWRDLQLDSFHTLFSCRVPHPIVMNVSTLSVRKTARQPKNLSCFKSLKCHWRISWNNTKHVSAYSFSQSNWTNHLDLSIVNNFQNLLLQFTTTSNEISTS